MFREGALLLRCRRRRSCYVILNSWQQQPRERIHVHVGVITHTPTASSGCEEDEMCAPIGTDYYCIPSDIQVCDVKLMALALAARPSLFLSKAQVSSGGAPPAAIHTYLTIYYLYSPISTPHHHQLLTVDRPLDPHSSSPARDPPSCSAPAHRGQFYAPSMPHLIPPSTP